MTIARVVWYGIAYVAFYVGATLLPAPSAEVLRPLARLFVWTPALLAAAGCGRAAREAGGAERAFWGTLAAACLVQPLAGELSLALVAASLLVRPDLPLGPGGLRIALLEWGTTLVGGLFLLVYFVIVPAGDASYPWRVVLALLGAAPVLLAAALVLGVREEPFRGIYGLVAFGFGAGAFVAALGRWAHGLVPGPLYSWSDLQWALPSFSLFAASLSPRGAMGLSPAPRAAGWRTRLAVAALCLPPAV